MEPFERPGTSSWILGLVLGSLAGALTLLALGTPPVPARAAAFLVLDRGGDRVLALDQELCVVDAVRVPSPRRIAPCADGGAWVAFTRSSQAVEPDRLLRLDSELAPLRELAFGPLCDLFPLESGALLALERSPDGAGIVWRIEDGECRRLQELPGARCVAGAEGRCLIGCSGGELVLAEDVEPGVVLAWRRLSAGLVDLAPGPEAGSWWALAAGRETELMLLERGLETRWASSLGFTAERLAPVEGEERVWLADALRSEVRRYGPGGLQEIELSDLGPHAAGAALVAWEGGVLLASPGALLELESGESSRPARTQGGFSDLSDLGTVRRHAAPRSARNRSPGRHELAWPEQESNSGANPPAPRRCPDAARSAAVAPSRR